MASAMGVGYVFTPADRDDRGVVYWPGFVRNQGLALATGEWVYANDSDVVFRSSRFFADVGGYRWQIDSRAKSAAASASEGGRD